jgi:hypothetical protein
VSRGGRLNWGKKFPGAIIARTRGHLGTVPGFHTGFKMKLRKRSKLENVINARGGMRKRSYKITLPKLGEHK